MSDDKIVVSVDKDLEEIMPGFLDNRRKDIVELDASFSKNDIESIKVIGHKLAGNAGGYGLPDLGNLGAQLEEACIQHDTTTIESLITQIKGYLEKLEIVYE